MVGLEDSVSGLSKMKLRCLTIWLVKRLDLALADTDHGFKSIESPTEDHGFKLIRQLPTDCALNHFCSKHIVF